MNTNRLGQINPDLTVKTTEADVCAICKSSNAYFLVRNEKGECYCSGYGLCHFKANGGGDEKMWTSVLAPMQIFMTHARLVEANAIYDVRAGLPFIFSHFFFSFLFSQKLKNVDWLTHDECLMLWKEHGAGPFFDQFVIDLLKQKQASFKPIWEQHLKAIEDAKKFEGS